jgi:hypothetical protein
MRETEGKSFAHINLLNEPRCPLHDYLQYGGRDTTSSYMFTSQRSSHLTEDSIHIWFRILKRHVNHEES